LNHGRKHKKDLCNNWITLDNTKASQQSQQSQPSAVQKTLFLISWSQTSKTEAGKDENHGIELWPPHDETLFD
jgi:hypothetical protein